MWYEDILGQRISYFYNIIQNITLTSLNQLNTLSSSFSFEHPSSKHSSSSGNSLSNSPSSSNLAFFGMELWLFMLLAMVSHAMLWDIIPYFWKETVFLLIETCHYDNSHALCYKNSSLTLAIYKSFIKV